MLVLFGRVTVRPLPGEPGSETLKVKMAPRISPAWRTIILGSHEQYYRTLHLREIATVLELNPDLRLTLTSHINSLASSRATGEKYGRS